MAAYQALRHNQLAKHPWLPFEDFDYYSGKSASCIIVEKSRGLTCASLPLSLSILGFTIFFHELFREQILFQWKWLTPSGFVALLLRRRLSFNSVHWRVKNICSDYNYYYVVFSGIFVMKVNFVLKWPLWIKETLPFYGCLRVWGMGVKELINELSNSWC